MIEGKVRFWVRSVFSALISGFFGGIVNGFAAMGIAPDHFNLQEPKKLAFMVLFSAIATAVLGVAMYLRQSPLPPTE